MSADNWTICPRCEEIEQVTFDSARKAIEATYGKVSATEYKEAVRALGSGPASPVASLREDYEIGVREGVFDVYYTASCRACGFSFEYNYEEEIVL